MKNTRFYILTLVEFFFVVFLEKGQKLNTN